MNRPACPDCGGINLRWVDGFFFPVCQDCAEIADPTTDHDSPTNLWRRFWRRMRGQS